MSFRNITCIRKMRENLLLLLILIGVVVGFVVGILLNREVKNSTNPSPGEIATYIYFPGEIFLRMLKLLILPLIVSSVIVSLAILDRKSMAKLGKCAVVYFFITTLLAVIFAVILASILLPDPRVTKTDDRNEGKKNGKAVHAILDIIRNIFPENIVEAAFSFTATKYKKTVADYKFVNETITEQQKSSPRNLSLFLKDQIINPWSLSSNGVQVIKEENPVYDFDGLIKYNSANILGILVFSFVFGAILSILGEEGKPMTAWFNSLFKITMKMVEIFMWYSPIGICSIVAGKLAAMEDINETVENLGMYIITMIIACVLHGCVILPTIYFMVLRKNPFLLFKRVAKAILIAFGTGSSSATIPIALTCLEENHKVDSRVARFVVPVGTTINKDGTGIYVAVAAIYIAQVQNGDSLDFGASVVVCLAATLASVAAAPIPGSAPIVTSTIVLQAIGIHYADISLILAVDWFITRVSSSLNVWGNCCASAVIESLSHKHILSFEGENQTSQPPPDCVVDFEVNVAVEMEENERKEEEEVEEEEEEEETNQPLPETIIHS